MQTQPPTAQKRELKLVNLQCDLVIVGGGLAGTCCAITAAGEGVKVVLIQDRPVLGGNASSEVRLWVLGATSHMANNNRWAREGGVADEILVENLARNPEGNPLIFDTVLLEKVVNEPNITLLPNAAVFDLTKSEADTIASVRAFCSQNSTQYEVSAPLFCDASGDGIVGFLAGAVFRMGAESAEEFGEKLAPTKEYGELLGHSIYFYTKDTGHPVKFAPPSFALTDITKIPRFRQFDAQTHGCRLWWIEYGGRLDTVHDTETIRWELWKVVYGIWNYIKNSGKFPEAETLTLEWVGQIPGKRESRRFEGNYILRQQDIVEQRHHEDAVSFGGWSIDLHPADGVYNEKPGCNQWHAKGIYQIPYRCLYSRNISNLFLAGRIISASHVAFGSTRVMATCANSAQAVGVAAALCIEKGTLPRQVESKILRRRLQRIGQHIPGFRLEDSEDLTTHAKITASSWLRLASLPPDGPLVPLTQSWAQMLPVGIGVAPRVTFLLDVKTPTTLELQLRISSRPDNHTPDITLATQQVELKAGQNQSVIADWGAVLDQPRYAFYCLMKNENVSVRASHQRLTGVLSLAQGRTQQPDKDIGVETFEMWTPRRRPDSQNFAVTITPPLDGFLPANVNHGVDRPTCAPNGWVADFADRAPSLTLQWEKPQTIARVDLSFDTDFDHPMESVLMGHPERFMPFCVKHYRLRDASGKVVAERTDNHQTRNILILDPPLSTDCLALEIFSTQGATPAAVFAFRCYSSTKPL